MLSFFFFQAEDGIRDGHVTGVQTCALPISNSTPWVIQRTLSTSVKPSWLIHRYLVHTSEARTSSTTRAPMASAVMPSGDRRRREAPLESGAGRARGRGASPGGAEKLTYILGRSEERRVGKGCRRGWVAGGDSK